MTDEEPKHWHVFQMTEALNRRCSLFLSPPTKDLEEAKEMVLVGLREHMSEECQPGCPAEEVLKDIEEVTGPEVMTVGDMGWAFFECAQSGEEEECRDSATQKIAPQILQRVMEAALAARKAAEEAEPVPGMYL